MKKLFNILTLVIGMIISLSSNAQNTTPAWFTLMDETFRGDTINYPNILQLRGDRIDINSNHQLNMTGYGHFVLFEKLPDSFVYIKSILTLTLTIDHRYEFMIARGGWFRNDLEDSVFNNTYSRTFDIKADSIVISGTAFISEIQMSYYGYYKDTTSHHDTTHTVIREVYNNPNSVYYFNNAVYNNSNVPANVRIINLNGQEVFSGEVHDKSDLNLPIGIYVLWSEQHGKQNFKKILVQ